MKTLTFAEIFCARHNLPHEEFTRCIFRRCLYRRARPFVGLLRFFRPNYFAADFDLIYAVEHLTRLRDFNTEAERFNEHPANRGWLRRKLRIRISTGKLKQLIKETLPSSAARRGVAEGTATPFEAGSDSTADMMPLAR